MKRMSVFVMAIATTLPIGALFAAQREVPQAKPVLTGDEAVRLAEYSAKQRERLDFIAAPIKSRSDLDEYIRITPKHLSPLQLLSDGGRKRFLDSLVFNENGLAGYDYVDLAMELRPTQAVRVLSLFGAQRTVSMLPFRNVESPLDKEAAGVMQMIKDDHKDYYCSDRATCSSWGGKICMSSC
jgi:hypothetical protein